MKSHVIWRWHHVRILHKIPAFAAFLFVHASSLSRNTYLGSFGSFISSSLESAWCLFSFLQPYMLRICLQDGVMQTHDEETRRFFRHSSVTCLLTPRYASSKLSIIKQQACFSSFFHILSFLSQKVTPCLIMLCVLYSASAILSIF